MLFGLIDLIADNPKMSCAKLAGSASLSTSSQASSDAPGTGGTGGA
jgi:hypothetical protein